MTAPVPCPACARMREALAFYANPGQWDDFVITRGLVRVDVGAPRVLSVPAGWMKAGYDKAQRALDGGSGRSWSAGCSPGSTDTSRWLTGYRGCPVVICRSFKKKRGRAGGLLSRRRCNRFFRLGKKLRLRSITLAGKYL